MGFSEEESKAAVEKLGIVLATYNEAGNLPRLVESLEELELTPKPQIFVVDDNSPDGTSRVAGSLASRFGNITLITRPGKQGLGSAIRAGMESALAQGCNLIMTMDADLSHDPEDVPRLLAEAGEDGVDLVLASASSEGGRSSHWGWWRRSKSLVANRLCRWFLDLPSGATTNFKVYKRRGAELVLAESRARDYEVQPESVLIVRRHRLRISTLPITFTGRTEGKSKLGMVHNLRWVVFFLGAVLSVRLGMGRFARVGTKST